LKDEILKSPAAEVAIHLDKQQITFPSGAVATFPIDPFSKFCLLNGVDELEYLRRFTKQVEQYEAAHAV
jgi:3-isopropylmalate/(R)-2-methylmalate dehydratase small subunit